MLSREGGCTEKVVPVGHGGGHHPSGYGYAPPGGYGFFPFGGMGMPFPGMGGVMAAMGGAMGGPTPGGKGEYKEVQIHGPIRLGQGTRRICRHSLTRPLVHFPSHTHPLIHLPLIHTL